MRQVYRLMLFVNIFLTICVCSACGGEQNITEEQAIQIVKKEFEDNQFGPIDITSVKLKGRYFEVIWTRDRNYEGGTTRVDVKTGETEGESYIY